MELHDRPRADQIQESDMPEPPRCGLEEAPPPDVYDPVIAAYKKDADRTLLIENLKLTPAQRAKKFEDFMSFLGEIQQAGRRLHGEE